MDQGVEFQRNQAIHGRVIDDLLNFPSPFFRERFYISYSEMSGENNTKLGRA